MSSLWSQAYYEFMRFNAVQRFNYQFSNNSLVEFRSAPAANTAVTVQSLITDDIDTSPRTVRFVRGEPTLREVWAD